MVTLLQNVGVAMHNISRPNLSWRNGCRLTGCKSVCMHAYVCVWQWQFAVCTARKFQACKHIVCVYYWCVSVCLSLFSGVLLFSLMAHLYRHWFQLSTLRMSVVAKLSGAHGEGTTVHLAGCQGGRWEVDITCTSHAHHMHITCTSHAHISHAIHSNFQAAFMYICTML